MVQRPPAGTIPETPGSYQFTDAQLLGELLDRIEVRIVDVDAGLAKEAMVSWRRFEKGRHRAGLNFGDTFSHALAVRADAPLFVGDDFDHTDVRTAVPPSTT